VWKNGQAYEGGFVDGLRSGLGVLEFDDLSPFDLYVGEFSEDEMWGYGTLTWYLETHIDFTKHPFGRKRF
jgi:hypothetical protein